MKKLMIIGWLVVSWLTSAASNRPDSDLAAVKVRFERAYAEIKAMLNGRTAVDLRRAVFLQEWAYQDGCLSYADFCKGIDSCAAAIRRFMDANGLGNVPIGGNIALYEFFSHPYSMNGYKPYTYDFDDPEGNDDYTHIFVSKLMRTHKGQCRSLPLFYKMLANEIGAEAYIAYAPRHTFIRHRDPQDTCWINLELTNHTISRDVYIAQMTGITQEALDKGTFLRSRTDREVLTVLMAELGTTYLRRIERIHPFVWKCIGMALHHDPSSLSALVLANNCLYAILCQHKRYLMERGLPDDAFLKDILAQLKDVNEKIDRTGHIEMPEEVAEKMRKAREQEKLRLEREVNRSEN